MTNDAITADGAVRPSGDELIALVPTESHENHASFLHRLPDGDIAAVWFGGSREGTPDVSIYLSRLDADAGRWSAAERVSPPSDRSDQNPVLATLPDGTLWLLYTAQEFGAQDTAMLMRRISTDEGRSWSAPSPLVPEPGVFIRQDLVVLESGVLLLPIFHCHALPGRQWFGDGDTSAVLRSEDGGASWTEIPVPESIGAVHMDIVPFGGEQLVGFFRSRWADRVYRSESSDAGLSWSAPVALEVPNNNSSIQMRRAPVYGPDTVFAVLNPLAAEPGSELGDVPREHDEGKVTAPGEKQPLERHTVWGIGRIPLSLFRSDDRGLSWRKVRDLETEDRVPVEVIERAGDRALEMSYPALLVDDEGTVHISYSYCRLAIKYVAVPRAAVEAAR